MPSRRLQPSEGVTSESELPMQSNPTTPTPRNGVLTLTGYGVTVNVERGGLAVSDGVADERRQATFRKATCGISRLVILGHSGTISLDAVRWLHDIGAALVQIDRDGRVLFASAPPGLDHAALRRAQALAATNQVGIELTRELLDAKLSGQAAMLREMKCQDAANGVDTDRFTPRAVPVTGDGPGDEFPADRAAAGPARGRPHWRSRPRR